MINCLRASTSPMTTFYKKIIRNYFPNNNDTIITHVYTHTAIARTFQFATVKYYGGVLWLCEHELPRNYARRTYTKARRGQNYDVTKLAHSRLISDVIPLIVSLWGIVSVFASDKAVFISSFICVIIEIYLRAGKTETRIRRHLLLKKKYIYTCIHMKTRGAN